MKKEQELLEAARLGNLQIVEKLLTSIKSNPWSLASLGLKSRVNVNCTDPSGYTPLHHAALNGHRDLVRVLLQNAAFTNIADNKGNFPLHLAAWSGFHEIVVILLSHGPSIARIDEKNNDRETALHCAAQHGHYQATEALLEAGAISSIRNIRGESPLDLASQYGRLNVVRLLLHHEPSLLKAPSYAFSPLHVASRNGHKEIVELLIAHGADVNSNSENGTPLHEASLFGKLDVVKLLLSRGANPRVLDAQGRSPLELVRHLDTQVSRDICKILLDRLQDSDDYVPLSPIANNSQPLVEAKELLSDNDAAVVPNKDASSKKADSSATKRGLAALDPLHHSTSTSATAQRSHTFKGLSKGWSRLSSRKIGFRRAASVRNSKSLPKLSSPTSSATSPLLTPRFRQFHPSSTQFPVARPAEENEHVTSLSILSLPAAVSSQSSAMNHGRRLTSCTMKSEDDCVFYSFNPRDHLAAVEKKQVDETHSELAHPTSPGPPALVSDPVTQAVLNKNSPRESQVSFSHDRTPNLSSSFSVLGETPSPSAKKPVKPVRQKLTALTSPPPLPPKPAPSRPNARPPSPSFPPPNDDFLESSHSDSDEASDFVTNHTHFETPDSPPMTQGQTNGGIEQSERFLSQEASTARISINVSPPFSPPSPSSAMLQVSETLQKCASQGQPQISTSDSGLPHQSSSNNLHNKPLNNPLKSLPDPFIEGQSFQPHTALPKVQNELRYSSSCYIESRVKKARILNTADNSTPFNPEERSLTLSQNDEQERFCVAPSASSSVLSLPNSRLPSDSSVAKTNPTETVSIHSVSTHVAVAPPGGSLPELVTNQEPETHIQPDDEESAATSEWSDDLSDRTEDFALPRALKRFRGLTRGASLKMSTADAPAGSSIRFIDDSEDSQSSCDELRRHRSCDASEDEATSVSRLPDINTIKDAVVAVRSRSQRGSQSGSSSSAVSTPVKSLASGLNDDEWTQIATAMSSVGTTLDRGKVYALQFQETFWKIMTGSSLARPIGSWLEDLGLVQYEKIFIANGYDDLNFLSCGILGDQDLLDMNITNSSHRKAILDSTNQLPLLISLPPPDNSSLSSSVQKWLGSIQLAQYEATFSTAGHHTVAQIKTLNASQIHQIISKRGHAKRVVALIHTSFASASKASITSQDNILSEVPPQTSRDCFQTATYKTIAVKEQKLTHSDSVKSIGKVVEETEPETKFVLSPSPQSLQSGHERAGEDEQIESSPPLPRSSSYEKKENSHMSSDDVSVPGRERAMFLSSLAERITLRPPNQATDEVKVSAWRHPQEALIQSSCNYQAYYLGSMLVEELRGIESTQEACSKMKKSTDAMKKIPCITLSINYAGVKFIDFKSKHEIAEHKIENISFASQDATDLATFAYITCDIKTGKHFSHIFRVTTMDRAYEIILTLGQAFEIAYQLIMKEKEMKKLMQT